MSDVPENRLSVANDAPVRQDGAFVLYWMIAARRVHWNFALQRAAGWARELGRPLIVLEALRSGYPWASDRLHRFILDGMADNARRLADGPAGYYGYIETNRGDGSGLLEGLAKDAAVVVTDDYPTFFLPRMLEAAGGRLDVRLEKVDANGLLPMRMTDAAYKTAHSFRRFLHSTLLDHLGHAPHENALRGAGIPHLSQPPAQLTDRWPNAAPQLRGGSGPDLAELPLDHDVAPVELRGGGSAAADALKAFLDDRLHRYDEHRNHPDEGAESGLSPYLHFGHLSSHQAFAALCGRESWDADQVSPDAAGRRRGWWGMSESAEAFLDQIVTWRELGFNMCVHRDDYDRYESLPDWARTTLEEHLDDEREHLYELDEFEASRTHDEVWNAAQNQLRREGRLHNYLRMLWGKKILEWSPTPRYALEVMIELNNKYALDGRDPNAYSGIFWCLGRYDRAFAPERPIYGVLRYMSSKNTLRKLRMSEYLERYAS